MNTEEAIQKIAAILDENRELKETIYGLNTDRNWWRTSAIDTEKERSHLDIELIECRNTIDEQNARIERIEGNIADREQHFNALDSAIDRTRELLHIAMDRIRTQNDEIAKKDDWISSYSKNDKRLNRMLDELRMDVQKSNELIDELEHTLDGHKEHIDEKNQEISMSEDDALDTIDSIWLIIEDWASGPSYSNKKAIEDIASSMESSKRCIP